MKSVLLTILTILILGSCTTSKYIFNADRFQNVGQLSVDNAAECDLKNGFKDKSPLHLVSIGEGIYPNTQKYTLETPKMFEKKANNFRLQTNYYFTPTDSLVKVILYQWDKSRTGDQKKEFQKQFNQLRQFLTDKLGDPKEINIEQKEFNEETYRDGIKWKGKDKVNAYLFMFGNDRTQYRQIRLAIYSE